MIQYTRGNLLEAQVDALVNTVNEVGVMGKGIALMFREAYPESAREYQEAAKAGRIRVGQMHVTRNHELVGPRWIIDFPTKKHWRHPSRLEWIREGLRDLARVIGSTRSPLSRCLRSAVATAAWSGPRCVERSNWRSETCPALP